MNPILYIILFLQIVVKGCRESTKAKALLITISIVIGSIFVPHFLGILVMAWFGITGVAWPMGAIFLVIIALAYIVIALIYLGIHDTISSKGR